MATPFSIAGANQFDIFGNPLVRGPNIQDPINQGIPQSEMLLPPQGSAPATPNLLGAVPRRNETQQPQPQAAGPVDILGNIATTVAGNKLIGSLLPSSAAATTAAAGVPATPTILSVGGIPTTAGITSAALPAAAAAAATFAGAEFLGKPLGEALVGGRHFDNRGANIGTVLGGLTGTVFGGALGGLFGSKKSRRERQRDGVRDYIRSALGPNASFIGTGMRHLKIEEHQLALGDDLTSTDPANPLHVASVALLDPIGQTIALSMANQQGITGAEHINSIREDATALFARAVADGSSTEEDVMNNTLALAHSFGLSATDIKRGIAESFKQQHIDWNRLRVYAASLGKIMGKDVDEMTQEIRQLGGF
jgi:hypothetical protein